MQPKEQNFYTENIEEREEAFDLKAWLFRVFRLWPWFLLTFSSAFLLSFLYLRYAKPVYQSTATILIKDEKKGGASVLDNPLLKELNLGGKGSLVENEIEVLRSFDLIEEVVKKQNLYLTVKRKGRIVDYTRYGKEVPFILEIQNPQTVEEYRWLISIRNNSLFLTTKEGGNSFPIVIGQWLNYKEMRFRFLLNNEYKKPIDNNVVIDKLDFEIFLSPIEITTNTYKNMLSIEPIGKVGSVITLTLTDLHPEKSTAALNGLIEVYNRRELEDKNRVNSNTIDFLTERLTVVERELLDVEGEVERFKRQNQISTISSQTEVFLEMSKGIDRLKAEQETKVNTIEELEKELILNQYNPTLVPSTLGIEEPSLGSLIQRHNDLVLKRDRLVEVSGLKNPGLIDINNQVRDIRKSLIENVRNLKASFGNTMNDIRRQESMLINKLGEIPSIEKNLIQISRDKNVKEQIYLFLLQKKEESALALAGSVNDSRTIEKPRTSGQISPKKSLVYGIAFGIAILLPFMVIVLLDFFNNKIGDRKEIEAKTMAPLLGEISFVEKLESPLQITPQSRSIVSEQFRGIRTGLSFTGKGVNAKTILITSHSPGEGKSFTCINLGASYALLNKKVVIIEFDLRKPKLTKSLGLVADQGISNYLTRDLNIDDILIEILGYHGNYWLLPAGPVPPNPAELILGPYMQKMMSELSNKFDHIIIDSPPYSVVTDATLLQQYVDINVIVLRQGFTVKDAYDDINQRIKKFPEYPTYQILNGVGKMKRYSNYGSKYGYGYEYGYFENGETKKSKFLTNFFPFKRNS